MNIPYMHIFMAASSIQHPASSIQHPAFAKTAAYKGSRGFTLVELSIVIVIIGLIVAGVVAGQTLIKQAQIRGVLSDVSKYKASVNTFKLTYNGLPGDITNATSYWPTVTRNGNGDRLISPSWLFNATEQPIAWQQLSLAGLVEGSYDGDAGTYAYRGRNIPAARINNGIYAFLARSMYGHQITNYIMLSNIYSSPPNVISGGIITGKDAFNIDQKLDDGTPHSGAILCVKGLNMGFPAGCPHEAFTTATGAFNLTETDNDVLIMWNLQ